MLAVPSMVLRNGIIWDTASRHPQSTELIDACAHTEPNPTAADCLADVHAT